MSFLADYKRNVEVNLPLVGCALTFFYKSLFFGFLSVLAPSILIIILSKIVFESRSISNASLLDATRDKERDSIENFHKFATYKSEINRRVTIYEDQIEELHLLEGMVVNRHADASYADECDSLLFSSIRFVALLKLGHKAKALEAWSAITKSQDNGKWFRHPTCHRRTSRDMIVGLLIALTQRPLDGEDHLVDFFDYVEENDGFFGDGPLSVSY